MVKDRRQYNSPWVSYPSASSGRSDLAHLSPRWCAPVVAGIMRNAAGTTCIVSRRRTPRTHASDRSRSGHTLVDAQHQTLASSATSQACPTATKTTGTKMADISEYLRMVELFWAEPHEAVRRLFSRQKPITVARAPGRLDVMGGIADYSGSLVLQLPIAEATFAAVQESNDGVVKIRSLSQDGAEKLRAIDLPGKQLRELIDGDDHAARAWFQRDESTSWAAYVAGTVIVLARHRDIAPERGLRIFVHSRVPEGKGVSSSAALEVATMQAVAALCGVRLDGAELARLCQVAENHIVGAPCGIMDQMTSALGYANHLLALLCQPAEVQDFVAVPESIGFWGIDSGIRHAVSGSDYTSVRTGAFMGYRIIADLAGLEASGSDACGVVSVKDPRWDGYLANLEPAEFAERFAEAVPNEMRGDEFLHRYDGTTDAVTRVDPERTYAVHQPTIHPIAENDRVCKFASILAAELDDAAMRRLGELMYGSHDSYSACGLGSDGTDLLVQLVRQAGPQSGLYGAKITGGGSGGTVAVLGRAGADDSVMRIAREYTQQTGREGVVFSHSSAGAVEFGIIGPGSGSDLDA